MSRTMWSVVVAGMAGLASGCWSCGGNSCSLMSRCGSPPAVTMGAPSGQYPAVPVSYGNPIPVGVPTSNTVRPENELPMPNLNIAPPTSPIPVPIGLPVKGK